MLAFTLEALDNTADKQDKTLPSDWKQHITKLWLCSPVHIAGVPASCAVHGLLASSAIPDVLPSFPVLDPS